MGSELKGEFIGREFAVFRKYLALRETVLQGQQHLKTSKAQTKKIMINMTYPCTHGYVLQLASFSWAGKEMIFPVVKQLSRLVP